MKTLFITFIFAFSFYFANANPVMPHPLVITELHFDNNGNWTIELKNTFDGWEGVPDLNNVRLTTSSGTYYFKQGINLNPGQIILVNNDSMQTPMTLNRDFDYIDIEMYDSIYPWHPTGFSLSFGNYPYFEVGPVGLNQSVELYQYGNPLDFSCVYMISSTSSLGIYPATDLWNNSKGVFQGYVYDGNNNPITTRQIEFTFLPNPQYYNSNNIEVNQQTGSFYKELYSLRYNITLKIAGLAYTQIDSNVVIEPGVINNCIFHFDFLEGINPTSSLNASTILNFPNPVSDHTTFRFELPVVSAFSKGIIKIFNNNGEIVKILPVNTSNLNDNKYAISLNINNDPVFVSGNYYYSLEIDGKKISSNKMAVIK